MRYRISLLKSFTVLFAQIIAGDVFQGCYSWYGYTDIHVYCVPIAILLCTGTQGGENLWMYQYGIQVFDLSVDQLCSLLQNVDPTKGEDMSMLYAAIVQGSSQKHTIR